MAEMTLTAAAEATGIPYDTLKKHAQRGQIRTSKDADGRPMIAQEDLEVYVAARNLTAAIDRGQFGGRTHAHADRRGREMADVEMDAEALVPGRQEMLENLVNRSVWAAGG